jgi:hypothetical protein
LLKAPASKWDERGGEPNVWDVETGIFGRLKEGDEVYPEDFTKAEVVADEEEVEGPAEPYWGLAGVGVMGE